MLNRRRFVAAAVAAAFAGGASLVAFPAPVESLRASGDASAAADQTPAQRELRQRYAYISVLGQNDVPIKDLKLGEVTVREDDRAREVLAVDPAPPADYIALLVDDSAAAEDAIQELRIALLDLSRYLAALPAPPRVGLTTFGERPNQRVQYTTGPAALQAGIGKLFGIKGAGAYFLEAVIEVSRDFRKHKAERPAIVAFVDDDGVEFSSAARNDVARELKAAGATLWVISLQKATPNVHNREWQERSAVMHEISKDSGGTSKVAISNLAIGSAYTWMTSLLTTQHRITYSRPESLIPPTKLSVEVKRPNVKVLARRWTGQ
jgi:hypothetical protein